MNQRTLDLCTDAIAEVYDANGGGATNEQLVRAVIGAYQRGRGLRGIEDDLRTVLDTHYPTDVFLFPVAPDSLHRADPGVRFVYRLREALEELR